MKIKVLILSCLLLVIFNNGCRTGSESPTSSLLRAYLIDGPWKLVASYQYDAYNAVVNKTNGSLADSLIFGNAPDANQNVTLTSIFSFIGGVKTIYQYSLKDSTVLISPVWKTGYSDTIYLVNFSDSYLTFKVKKINDPLISYELDSLKKIRFYN